MWSSRARCAGGRGGVARHEAVRRPVIGVSDLHVVRFPPRSIAQAVGAPVFDFIKQVNAELAACDTETCRWQLRTATGANVVHPIWLIHKAYGLPNG